MDLSILNKDQKEAVTAPLGPVLVLAGAGSGKTRVLTYRVAYLIEQDLIPAERILAVTFTNKAAKEMQKRIIALLSGKTGQNFQGGGRIVAGQPTLGTFHSIGARLLRSEIGRIGYARNFVILDSDDQSKIIKDILAELNIPKQFAPNLFRSYISSAKNLLQTPQEFDLGLDGYINDLVQQVYVRYQNFIYKQNSLDFDDLLMLPIKIFEAFPDVLRKYQNIWKYILVDEYQDTNQAQYMFLHMLSAQSQNLFVVGDDAQSIYGFRGSNIANILNFENDFKKALVIKLEQNYRSSQNILAAAQKVIELNAEQKPKTLWTENEKGSKVVVEELFDGRAEALYVVRKIISMVTPKENNDIDHTNGADSAIHYEETEPTESFEEEISYGTDEDDEPNNNFSSFSILDHFLAKQKNRGGGVGAPRLPAKHSSLNEFAILYRTHAQSRQMEEVLIEGGIPYQMVGGVKFYERKEIKDAIAYLRLIINPQDLISLKRVINLPPRGIGDKSFSLIKEYIFQLPPNINLVDQFLPLLAHVPVGTKQRESLKNFYSVIESCASLAEDGTLSDLLRMVVKITRMEEYLKDGTEVGDVRIENVKELSSVTSKFDHLPWHEGLEDFLEEVALITDLDKVEAEKDSVTLMTLHAAKGLEFDTVFFVGLEEGVLPHAQSLMDPTQLAEEVRLAYVGLTRARRKLFLLYAQSRQIFGTFQSNPPSRILRALPQEVISFKGNAASLHSEDDSYTTYRPILD